MDSLVKRFDGIVDNDLFVCMNRGIAYQRDMTKLIEYGDAYFNNYVQLEGKEIAKKINDGRVSLVNKYVGSDAVVLDVGIGSGEFIKSRPNTVGYDVNPKAMAWLADNQLLAGPMNMYSAFSFWDVLEHIPSPHESYFKRFPNGCYLFTCLPVFDDLSRVRKSRHYKPGEHLYYWTTPGFIAWMAEYRFRLLEVQNFETDAGRDSISSFAFIRDLPGYHDTLVQYQKLHSPAYGTSAYLYFKEIAHEVIELNPNSILDFGCGRSDMVAHFWKDGARKIEKYDPAIPQFKHMPEGKFDLVLCTDVMEHIPMLDIENVLNLIRSKSKRTIFTISMKPARAKLPDGRNAHISLMSDTEWIRWIDSLMPKSTRIKSPVEQVLMVKTF